MKEKEIKGIVILSDKPYELGFLLESMDTDKKQLGNDYPFEFFRIVQ